MRGDGGVSASLGQSKLGLAMTLPSDSGKIFSGQARAIVWDGTQLTYGDWSSIVNCTIP